MLSKYAGERFDLVQAGGGNSSVKLEDGTMLIKASGFMLSEVEMNNGYVKVKNRQVAVILNKRRSGRTASDLLKKTVVGSGRKPSIEIFLHSLLHKYTLHIHPLAAGAVTSRKNWKNVLIGLFGGDVALVEYRTPGLGLALELKKIICRYQTKYGRKPKLIFLQNHGLIASSDDPEEIPMAIEETLKTLEDYLGMDLKRYKLTNRISGLVNSAGPSTHYVSYLSSDTFLNRFIKTKRDLFSARPFVPDELVYCGVEPLEIRDLEDVKPFIKYRQRYLRHPAVVIYGDFIFFIAKNVRKAKENESVFKAHILMLHAGKGGINFLSRRELLYLGGWEDEKYRQEL